MSKKYSIKRHDQGQFKINYEAELDAQQLQVVTAPAGPTLVIAGAGSGKTRAVTYRVARLIESGVSPDRILLVTFTNKAAREMLQRVELLVTADIRRIWGGTFHSIGNRILRRHAESLNYTSGFTILDSEDAKDVLEAAVEDAGIDLKSKRFPQPGLLQDLLSLSINRGVPAADLIASDFPNFEPLTADIERVFARYAKRKLGANAMDYDDLLGNWKRLLIECPEVHKHWSDHFQHILVDEYQDTNKLQADIVDLLATVHRNVMVVGDDAQSIYGFRGAHFENIYGFSERYADASVLRLENNYRSRPEILALANASIKHNLKQFPKTLMATRPASGEKPALVPLANVDEQAAFVSSRILDLHAQGMPLSDMAVLYRSHWHSLELQLDLTRRNLPYSIRSGMRFFEQAHIKDVVAHLRIIVNPKDEAAWRRVLKLIPGVGRATAARIWERIASSEDPLALIVKDGLSVKPRAGESWRAFVEMIGQLAGPALVNRPAQQIEVVLAGGYQEYLSGTFENADLRAEDLHQLARYAIRFAATEDFLSDLSLIGSEGFGVPQGTGGEDQMEPASEDDQLVLTSIHQAKGLEWKVVFLIWAAEGKLPSSRSLKEAAGQEEERRLFYVAITRARDELYVCYPLMESDYTRLTVVQRPSRFVSEIPEDLFEVWTVD